MVHIGVLRAGEKSNLPKTMVLFVRKNGKKTEAIGADRDIAEVIESLMADGVTEKDMKKGLFLRAVGEDSIVFAEIKA